MACKAGTYIADSCLMRNLISTSLMAIFTLCLLSCSDVGQSSRSDHDQAIEFMDQGDYSSAIFILTGRLTQDDQDKRARTLLAAAYAGRAGILFTDFFDLAKLLAESSRSASQYFDQGGLVGMSTLREQSGDRSSKNIFALLDKFYQALFHVNRFLQAFELVPEVHKSSSLKDLKTAIYLLSADNNLEGGSVMYRGLLRVTLLKYKIKSQYRFELSKNCELDLKNFTSDLNELYVDIKNVLIDVAMGTLDLDKRKQIMESTSQLDQSFKDVLGFAASLSQNSSRKIDVSKAAKDLGAKCR